MLLRGLLVAVDAQQEWLLPWWWANYSAENSLPVTIVDLGMSKKARTWCEQRAQVEDFAFDPSYIKQKADLDAAQQEDWEAVYGKSLWQSRQAWFKKPFAMLMSHYHLTLWVDLDCEILGPLDSLFDELPKNEEFALVREPMIRQGDPALLLGEVLYNSGVILYRQNAALLKRWADASQDQNGEFWGDQHLLARLIFQEKFSVHELPEIYNTQLSSGINPHAIIIHWLGSWGKEYIRKHGGLRRELKPFKNPL